MLKPNFVNKNKQQFKSSSSSKNNKEKIQLVAVTEGHYHVPQGFIINMWPNENQSETYVFGMKH